MAFVSRHPPKIAVAMSGGVDSSVVAALLMEQGHEVIGVHMTVAPSSGPLASAAAADARQVAEGLGVAFHAFDLRDEFQATIIAPFMDEYLSGRTPTPCVRCNPTIKFGVLMDKARALGAEAFATGHYARVENRDGRWCLMRAAVGAKDQSYYLSRLSQEQLSAFLTPLGAMDKAETRRLAQEKGLSVAQKDDSQDVCFIPDGDYKAFIEARAGDRLPGPGEIVDGAGRVLGRHQGAWRYTVGQRRGIGVSASEPLYVLAIDWRRNRLVVGPRSACFARTLTMVDVNYVALPSLSEPIHCAAQIRFRHRAAAARVEPFAGGSRLRVTFEEPQSSITPGQAVVLYDGDTVLAGGWIRGAEE